MKALRIRFICCLLSVVLIDCRPVVANSNSDDTTTAAMTVFEQRILPILQSSKPSSCSECHLSGVDLKAYIRPTQKETFASLLAAELIDLEKPDDSKLLQFIKRRPESPSLITDRVRDIEYQAFRDWIHAAIKSPELLSQSDASAPIGPSLPNEVIRHGRKDRVLASFIDNVWTEVGRCAACHSPDRNKEHVQQHGDQVSWIKLNDPQATLDHMLQESLINVDSPSDSLLLSKPLMQVEHGGGQKMVIGDRTYKQFRSFIDDYASIVKSRYASPEQLPVLEDEASVVSEIWLKIDGVPAHYDKLLLQVDLYYWTGSEWTEFRVATSDRPIFGGGNLWQHSLTLIAPRESTWMRNLETQALPAGRYRAKLYLDRSGKLARDFTQQLSEEDRVGEVDFETQWPSGYDKMTIIAFPNSSRE